MKLSIVIPAHNEETRLEPSLESYASYFTEKYDDEVEFIVVVNGSSDRTEEIAKAYAGHCPQMRVLVEPRRVGKGGAVVMGFRESAGALVGFVDADGSTAPDAFADLVEHIGEADAIIASRWLKDSVVKPRQPLARRCASRVFNTLVRLFFWLGISDTQCGAKVFRGEAIRKVLPGLGLTRWAFDVDLLFQLRRAKCRIIEWPTEWHDVPGSKLNIKRAPLEMFLAVCRLRLLYSPFRWIIAVYDKTLGPHIHLDKYTGKP